MANETDDVKVDATPETTETASEVTTEDKSSSTEDKIDYEAELKAERERTAKLEKAIADRAFKDREAKREHVPTDEAKPLTIRDLQDVESRIKQETHKELQEARALEVARAHTTTEAEAQAALAHWRTRIVPTGNLEEDIQYAVAGLNHRKTVAKNAELARALRAKGQVTNNAASTHRDAPEGSEPKLSAGDVQAMHEAGLKWNGSTRVYEKKLANGKVYFFDPRTRQRGAK